MFSKTCEYAVRAVIFIAQKSIRGEKAGIKEIVDAIACPEYFIAKILQDLVKKSLLLSIKGPNGGFYMDKPLLDNTLADIVKAVDGDRIFQGCGLGLSQCSESHPCPIHHKFKKVRNDLHAMLSGARVGEFTGKLEKNLAFLKRD